MGARPQEDGLERRSGELSRNGCVRLSREMCGADGTRPGGDPEKPTRVGPQAEPEETEAPPWAGTMPGGPSEQDPRGHSHVMAGGEGGAPSPVGLGKTAEPRLDAQTRETGNQTGPELVPESRQGRPSKSREGRNAPNKGKGPGPQGTNEDPPQLSEQEVLEVSKRVLSMIRQAMGTDAPRLNAGNLASQARQARC